MGNPNPRPEKFTVGTGDAKVVIYAKAEDLSAFVTMPPADVSKAETTKVQAVKSHSRRRYPGGPTTSVAGHNRTRIFAEPNPEQTLPGYNAWLERTVGTGEAKQTLVEQFTYRGDFQDLKVWVKSEAIVACVLRSPWGAPYKIAAGALLEAPIAPPDLAIT
jgi:hypothetical protein